MNVIRNMNIGPDEHKNPTNECFFPIVESSWSGILFQISLILSPHPLTIKQNHSSASRGAQAPVPICLVCLSLSSSSLSYGVGSIGLKLEERHYVHA
jgi:hypothetical protein